MKCQRKLIGSCALSFGAGVLLSIFLPPVVMVCITSVVVVGAGGCGYAGYKVYHHYINKKRGYAA